MHLHEPERARHTRQPDQLVRNLTALPARYLVCLVAFCRPVGLWRFSITFKGSEAPCGRADDWGRAIVGIGQGQPCSVRKAHLRGFEETLLYITAHELQHVHQGPGPREWRERDADAHALRCLRRYRRAPFDKSAIPA